MLRIEFTVAIVGLVTVIVEIEALDRAWANHQRPKSASSPGLKKRYKLICFPIDMQGSYKDQVVVLCMRILLYKFPTKEYYEHTLSQAKSIHARSRLGLLCPSKGFGFWDYETSLNS